MIECLACIIVLGFLRAFVDDTLFMGDAIIMGCWLIADGLRDIATAIKWGGKR